MDILCTDVPWKSELVVVLYRKLQAFVAHWLFVYAQLIFWETPCSKGASVFSGHIVGRGRNLQCVTRRG